MKYKVCGQKIKNMPWQEKPEGWELPLWRYNQNPIIKRNPIKGIARIFNSAVVYKDGEYVGVFRAEDTSCLPHLRMGYSKDIIMKILYNVKVERDDDILIQNYESLYKKYSKRLSQPAIDV